MSEKSLDRHTEEFHAVQEALKALDCKKILLTDRPDIIVETKQGKVIGIEVTDCIVSKIRSNGSWSRTKVKEDISKAEHSYEQRLKKRGENINVELNLVPNILDSMKDLSQKQVIDSFVDEIERHRKNDWIINNFFSKIKEPEFNRLYNEKNAQHEFDYKYIESIDCWDRTDKSSKVFHVCCFCFSDKIQESDIEDCLKKKEEKIKHFKQLPENANIDEYWLVISVPSDEYISIADYEQTNEIRSSYNRVFLSNRFDGAKRLK